MEYTLKNYNNFIRYIAILSFINPEILGMALVYVNFQWYKVIIRKVMGNDKWDRT